ncbi:MAG: M20 family metallopeptidase [Ignavibacteria bacterium]|nr:M20 family metallopeptidase [Ignavibacteria bacterium]
MINKIKDLSLKFTPQIINLRRKLHANPELSFKEHRTTSLLESEVAKFRPDGIKRITETGFVALIKGSKKGKCVALRADIDALPIEEKTGLPFSSRNRGVMHACGHDAHSAMLFGAGRILSEIRDDFEGSVKLIFQPAEEKNPGGASVMIKNGVLKNPKVDAIFGQHILPDKKAGTVGFYPGTMMASQDELYVTIKGRSGHAAKPQVTVDPVLVASVFISSIQTIVSRKTDPYESVVLSICSIHGGSATNVIPEEVKLSGTLRTLKESVRRKVIKDIEKLLRGITKSYGASYRFEISHGYPELVNSPDETLFAESAAKDYLGYKGVFRGERFMYAEDFAYYLKEVPGSFYWIGAGNTTGLHTATMNLDEKTLPVGAGLMAYIAWKYLTS